MRDRSEHIVNFKYIKTPAAADSIANADFHQQLNLHFAE